MNITEYITAKGEARIAADLGVSIWTARSWRLGTRVPRQKHANALVAYSGGELSLAGIYSQAPAPEARHAA